MSASTFTVIEGAHRTMACKRCLTRGIPFSLKIYIVKDIEPTEACMLINNTQSGWKAYDRLMSYCRQKNSKWFMKAETYNITSALALLSPLSSHKVEDAFRNGTLVLTEEMIETAEVTFNQLRLICEILGSRKANGEPDMSPIKRYRIKEWIRARDSMQISMDQFMNRLKRRVDAGKWEEPSEKNWFNAYMDIASLKR